MIVTTKKLYLNRKMKNAIDFYRKSKDDNKTLRV